MDDFYGLDETLRVEGYIDSLIQQNKIIQFVMLYGNEGIRHLQSQGRIVGP